MTSTLNSIIDMDKIDTTVIDEVLAKEAVDQGGVTTGSMRFVSMLALREVANSYASRNELGSPDTGSIGGAIRGMMSSNSRARAIRDSLKEFVNLDDIWEIRDTEIAEFVFEYLCKKLPDASLRLLADIAFLFCWASIIADKKLAAKYKDFAKSRDELIDLIESASTGKELSDEEQDVVLEPWTRKIFPENKTIKQINLFDLERITNAITKGESITSRNRTLESLSLGELTKEVNALMTGTNNVKRCPALGTAAFGAMQANLPAAAVTGAVSVNMSFTTTAVETKQSLFTAFGDLQTSRSHRGSDHLGNIELNTGVFQETFVHSMEQWKENLAYLPPEAQRECINGFYRAQVEVTPNGGQRAHVTRALPKFMLWVFSSTLPNSYESAFAKPLKHDPENGNMLAAAQRAVDEVVGFGQIYSSFQSTKQVVVLGVPEVINQLKNIPDNWIVAKTFDELIDITNQFTGV